MHTRMWATCRVLGPVARPGSVPSLQLPLSPAEGRDREVFAEKLELGRPRGVVPVPQASADATRDGCPAGAHAAPLTVRCPWPPGLTETLQARACTVPAPPGLLHPDKLGSGSPSPSAETRLVTCLLAPLLGLLGPRLDTPASLPGSHPGESVDGASDLLVSH